MTSLVAPVPGFPASHGLPHAMVIERALDDLTRHANSGGPMSRTRNERLFATVLGVEDGPIRCPRVLRVGLDFGRRQPLACARELLRHLGFDDEQQAREAMALPLEGCICRPDRNPSPAPISSLPPGEALFQALVLGLSTPWCYDPRRPVLWTAASLTRQLELFDGREFYA